MNNQKDFKNISLFSDLIKKVYPLNRYHFQVEPAGNPGLKLNIFTPTVRKIDNSQVEPLRSYNYNYRDEIINDLNQWRCLQDIQLVAIIEEPTDQHEPVTLKVTFDKNKTMPKEISEILNCVSFWNKQGQTIYVNNIYCNLGDKNTNEQARRMPYNDWLLLSIFIDCNVFIIPSAERFKTGKGGNNIWIAENDERILMIHL